MIYNDGVPMDDNYRVKYCPRCKNHEIDSDSEFCQICGLSLYNVCVGDWNEDSPEHKNKSNARYCRICGRPTTYFQQDLLISYDKYITIFIECIKMKCYNMEKCFIMKKQMLHIP